MLTHLYSQDETEKFVLGAKLTGLISNDEIDLIRVYEDIMRRNGIPYRCL
jgi:hypothetical protein